MPRPGPASLRKRRLPLAFRKSSKRSCIRSPFWSERIEASTVSERLGLVQRGLARGQARPGIGALRGPSAERERARQGHQNAGNERCQSDAPHPHPLTMGDNA